MTFLSKPKRSNHELEIWVERVVLCFLDVDRCGMNCMCPWALDPKSLLRTSLIACATVCRGRGGGVPVGEWAALWTKVLHKRRNQKPGGVGSFGTTRCIILLLIIRGFVACLAAQTPSAQALPTPLGAPYGLLWYVIPLPRGKSQSTGRSDPAPQLGVLARSSSIWIKDDPPTVGRPRRGTQPAGSCWGSACLVWRDNMERRGMRWIRGSGELLIWQWRRASRCWIQPVTTAHRKVT